jgi:hypothetical protein
LRDGRAPAPDSEATFEEYEIMNWRIIVTVLGALLVSGDLAAAPPGDVAFTVPLSLTQLSPDLAKVRVACIIRGQSRNTPIGLHTPTAQGLSSEVVVPDTGQINRTVTVLVRMLQVNDTWGTSSSYECNLETFTNSTQAWHDHLTLQVQTPGLYLALSPPPARITGSITW